MYDSHAHLISDEIECDLEQILDNFILIGGEGILNVGYDIETSYKVVKISKRYKLQDKVQIKSSIGLHPELFYKNGDMETLIRSLDATTQNIRMLSDLLSREREYIDAIGETGLDYFRIKLDDQLTIEEKEHQIDLQKHSFVEHLKLARKYKLPMTIHLRDTEGSDDAIVDALKIVAQYGGGVVSGSFHSYTLSPKYLDEIFSLGFYIGINGIVTYRSGDVVREIVKLSGLENLLLETDTPYLPPQKIRSDKRKRKYSEPSDIREIAESIASVLSDDTERVIRITGENFQKLFGA